MHQAAGNLILGDQIRYLSVIFQAPDVVDQVGPRFQGSFHYLTLIAVDGHRDVKITFHHLNHRQHPVDFLLVADLDMSGAGRFPADINNGGSLRDHLSGMLFGCLQIIPLSAIGKGVGRHIEDAHDIAVIFHVKQTVSYFHHVTMLLLYYRVRVRFFFSALQLHS